VDTCIALGRAGEETDLKKNDESGAVSMQHQLNEARDAALRADARVLAAIQEGDEALAAKPPRSRVFATKKEFRRAFG